MFLFKRAKKAQKAVVPKEEPKQAIDLELVIRRLQELEDYMPEQREDLEKAISQLREVGYSEEFERILKSYIKRIMLGTEYFNIENDFHQVYSHAQKFAKVQSRAIICEDGMYKVYPEDLPEVKEHVSQYFQECSNLLVDNLFHSDRPIFMIFADMKMAEEEKLKSCLQTIKKAGIKDYCGDTTFLLKRMSYIIECVKEVIAAKEVSESAKTDFQTCLPIMEQFFLEAQECVSSNLSGYQKYVVIETQYKEMLRMENVLSENISEIWKGYLTDLNNFDGTNFHLILHSLTGGLLPPDQMGKMCTTLVCKDCVPVPYGKFGYIVDFDIHQITSMCSEDAGSWVATKDEFIDRGLPDTWQCFEKSGGALRITGGEYVDEPYVWFECPSISKLILPSKMEKTTIERNIQYRGSALGESSTCYNEIYFTKTDVPIKVVGMFVLQEEELETVSQFMQENHIDLPLVEVDRLTGTIKVHQLEDVMTTSKKR